MTVKQFEIFPQNVAKDGTLIIIQKGLKLYNINDVVDLLNTLHEENEAYKLRGLTENEYHQRYNHLIQLINNKINDYENRLDDSDIDDNLPYYMNIKGKIEVLKELRDEVKQWELKQ